MQIQNLSTGLGVFDYIHAVIENRSLLKRISQTNFMPHTNPKPVLFLMIVLISATSSGAQHLKYKVVKGEKDVGQMTALKKEEGDSIYYKLTSRTELKILFTIRVDYELEERYHKGVLVSGNSLSTLNGGVQKQAEVKKFDTHYTVEHTSDIYTIARREIRYSIPEIYFSPPKEGQKTVFSQVFGKYVPFEKVGERKYLLDSEDGKNIYHYDETGICTLVEISRAYANFNLVLVDE